MKNKKKFAVFFLVIIIIAFLVVGFLFLRNKIMLNTLKSEINNLTKLDVGNDKYNTKIRTSGDYAIVETAIKEYMNNYALLLQETLKIKDDEKFTKILSYDNYVADGPDFVESFKYLTDEKLVFNKNIDKLLDMSSEEAIVKYGELSISDQYYLSLYKELILSDDMKNNFWSTRDNLVTTREDINKIFEHSGAALTLLATNKNFWKLEDGEIKLLSQSLYDNYMAIINELN